MLSFIAISLQLYKIFKITRVSFFGTHYRTAETIDGTGTSLHSRDEILLIH